MDPALVGNSGNTKHNSGGAAAYYHDKTKTQLLDPALIGNSGDTKHNSGGVTSSEFDNMPNLRDDDSDDDDEPDADNIAAAASQTRSNPGGVFDQPFRTAMAMAEAPINLHR